MRLRQHKHRRARARLRLLALTTSAIAACWTLALTATADPAGAEAEPAGETQAPAPRGSGKAADEPKGGDGDNSTGGIDVRPPLSDLPAVPRRLLPEAKREDLILLDELLARLTSDKPGDRTLALEEVLAIDSSLLPAVKARIDQEAERANRAGMKRLLLDTRGAARAELEKEMRRQGVKGEIETPDYFPMMLSHPKPGDEDWQRLVRVLALSRMCVQLGTVEAVRVLIHVYVRFDFLRIDTQLQLKKLGDRSLAALIETTRHKAATTSNWAKRRLDFLGKAIPSEVVQVEDPQVLADVLRAYGRTRDPDAARLVISFANSERAQVRQAARQAVAMFGETANWSLRDTYENMVGTKPPREWSWDRTARELFREFDSIRLAELFGHYKQGLQALAKDDLDAMLAAFDKVVARSPNFEPRDKLVEGYLRFARQKFDEQPAASESSLLRVMRMSTREEERNAARSLLLTIEAKQLADKQVADRSLLQRAIEIDPENERARQLLDELSQEPFSERSGFVRWIWPAAIGAAATLFALLIAFVRFRSSAVKPN